MVKHALRQNTLVFGCLHNKCVSTEEYPIRLGEPGTQVTICAQVMAVTIKFQGATPFDGLPDNSELKISAGSCHTPLTVREDVPANTLFHFDLICGDGKHCKTPNAGPEMIVP